MHEPLTLALCALRICAAVSSLLASTVAENHAEAATLLFDGVAKGGEAAKDFIERDQPILAGALREAGKRLERRYHESVNQTLGPDARKSADVAFANFADVIARCLPSGADLAKMEHDPEKIALAVVNSAALTRKIEVFADPYGRARDILTKLVGETYRELRGDAKFMDTLQGVNWAEALGRLGRIEGKIDANREESKRLYSSAEAIQAQRHGEIMLESRRQTIQASVLESKTDRVESTTQRIESKIDRLTSNRYASYNLPFFSDLERGLAAALETAERGAADGDPLYRHALDLIKAGRVADAEPIFRAFAVQKEIESVTASKLAASAYKNLAAICRFRDPDKALEAYKVASRLDPDDGESLLCAGHLLLERGGNISLAEEQFRRAFATTREEDSDD